MAGELVIRKGGYLGIEDTSDDDAAEERGKGQVFADDPEDCCCCDPCENADPKPYKIITSWTSRRDYPAKDLKPYKKKGMCFKYWKIAEGELYWSDKGCWTGSSGSQYEGGSIENGELIGLPDQWTSGYSYEGGYVFTFVLLRKLRGNYAHAHALFIPRRRAICRRRDATGRRIGALEADGRCDG